MVLPPLLLVLAQARAGDCPEPLPAGTLEALAADARAAWVALDREAFERATAARRSALPCVDEPIGPALALELHLAEALSWSLERRSDLDSAELRAVLAIDHAWELPLELAPEHHRLREDFDAVRATPGDDSMRQMAAPAGFTLRVDGRESSAVPSARPFLAQVLDSAGRVVQSAWFGPEGDPGAAVAAWLPAAAPPEEPLAAAPLPSEPPPVAPVRRGRRGIGLLSGGTGLVLVTGGLYALATVHAGALEQGAVPCDELVPAANRVNGLVIAAGGAGVAAVGLLTAGLAIRF
ncbi:MAG: hypothetical protein ABIO70_16945 [Pseudomonadota bacterium]